MQVHNLEQLSDEWFAVRELKMTASNAQAIGNQKAGLDTYINQLLAEYYSSAEKENYTNKEIERGLELEEQAREIYELGTGLIVEQVGFIEYDKYTGCSPDGLVGKNGGIEIKCINDVNYVKHLLGGKINSGYIWQIQMCLLVTGRKWWDYVAYNPNFKKSIFIKRIKPDKKAHDSLLKGLEIGKKKIKDGIKKINETNTNKN